VSVSDDLERIDRERPIPPALLYKYVIPDRVDVLESSTIRFTPPLNTNDIFEVRQTFDLIMGPKMTSLFKDLAPEADVEEPLRNALDELGLSGISNEQAKALFGQFGGGDLEATMRRALDEAIERMPGLLNTQENIEHLLEKFGSEQLLLSLSESPYSSPMWAHYAANSTGFVIAFDTASQFFRRGEKGELQGLHKVNYFDGKITEIIDNPYGALISKQADWSYEREWRLYVKPEAVSKTVPNPDESIQLVEFPKDAVRRVILGLRASTELEERLLRVLRSDYKGVSLVRLKADRASASLIEEAD
jgi:hypothetical protein